MSKMTNKQMAEKLRELSGKASGVPWSNSATSSVVGSLIDNGNKNVCAVMPQMNKRECESNSELIAILRNHALEFAAALEEVETLRQRMSDEGQTCGCGDIRPKSEFCGTCGKCALGCCMCVCVTEERPHESE